MNLKQILKLALLNPLVRVEHEPESVSEDGRSGRMGSHRLVVLGNTVAAYLWDRRGHSVTEVSVAPGHSVLFNNQPDRVFLQHRASGRRNYFDYIMIGDAKSPNCIGGWEPTLANFRIGGLRVRVVSGEATISGRERGTEKPARAPAAPN